MAVYKVPQDVEADDKLIGPFSFRQFIYLMIAAGSIALAWGLSRLFLPLLIIPLPVIIFFGALALPLRKDQPMEIYLAAIVSFYLKPRKRLWQPDGIQSLVEITAPKEVEVQRIKDLSQSEAQQRLSYLADIVDTRGWAVRGVAMPEAPSAMQNDVYFEAQQTEDVLDNNGGVSRSFDSMITQADTKRRQDMIARMHQTAALPPAPAPATPTPLSIPVDPYAAFYSGASSQGTTPTPSATSIDDPTVTFNPYPNSMHQSVVTPLSQQRPVQSAPIPQPTQAPTPAAVTAPQPVSVVEPITTSEKVVSPDIINLANNSDLSIETIAHEAKRIHQQETKTLDEEEVVISLR
jgi:hypothetical protein